MRIAKTLAGGAIAGLAAACMVAMMANPAAAQTGSAADRINRALVSAGVPQSTAGPNVGTSKVEIPSDKPAALLTAAGKSVSLTLQAPRKNRDARGISYSNGGNARAFGDIAPDTDSLVRSADGGAQILAVMRTASAANTQRYNVELPPGTHMEAFGKAFNLVEADGKIVGQIAAPWAKDATGRELSTSYRLEGATLIQSTDTTNATYPVVVDPKITYGVGIYLNMWGSEAKAYAIAIVGLGELASRPPAPPSGKSRMRL
ncbi:hypothetical protein [Micromonospora zhanjiangensis]